MKKSGIVNVVTLVCMDAMESISTFQLIPHHGVGVRGAPGERVAQVEELAVRELEGGQSVAGRKKGKLRVKT